jgi:hypothetical protein
MEGVDSSRVAAVAGVGGAIITIACGILHPKGTKDLGSVPEWMSLWTQSAGPAPVS